MSSAPATPVSIASVDLPTIDPADARPVALDPAMAAAVERSEAEMAGQPDMMHLSHEEARRLMERTARWRNAGGPRMSHTEERVIAGPRGALRLRLYRPTEQRPLPVLVYMHGGGWRVGSLDTHDRLCREFAAGTGCAVLAVDYGLSPETRFPDSLMECVAACRWAASPAGAAAGLDGARVAVAGDSAGGNLAAAAALVLRDQGQGHLLSLVVVIYGVLCSRCDTGSYRRYGDTQPFLSASRMRYYWELYARDDEARRHPWAAPLHAELAGLPPTLVSTGDVDVLHDENVLFARRLLAAGVPVQARVHRGLTHAFINLSFMVPAAAQARDEICLALRRAFRLPPPHDAGLRP